MGALFWIRRYIIVFIVAAAVIACGQFLRGRTLHYSIVEALIWGLLTAGIYIATAIYRFRKGQHCAVCKLPESVPSKDPSAPQS